MSLAVRVYPSDRVESAAPEQPVAARSRAGWIALAVLVAALTPALVAIWAVPWFVTQDGPAHVYNAEILASSVGSAGEFDRMSPWHNVYRVRWQPIPNWAGSLVLAALVANLPAWLADRLMTSMTLAGFAASILWLRWRVAGARGLCIAGLLSVMLSLNMAWLYGFSSFMLGACLFPITLGFWWPHRDRLTPVRIAIVGLLLTIGYFCHLVSLGLTVLAMAFISVAAPVQGDPSSHWWARFARLGRTCASMVPVVVLGIGYLQIATHRAPMRPLWRNLTTPWSPRYWMARLDWTDPVSLAVKDGLPFTDRDGRPFIMLAPVIWLGIALVIWAYVTIRTTAARRSDRRGWMFLAALLIAGGIAGPDSFGEAHGDYLPQRIVLLGLVAIVPIFDISLSTWSGRGVTTALAAALLLQSAIVWDYAFYSDRTAGQIIRARDAVADGQRVAAVLASTRSRFRANPLLHAENWLGVGTGNVIWNNYETLHYYFPVQFQPGLDRPRPDDLEWVSIHEDPGEVGERSRAWKKSLRGTPTQSMWSSCGRATRPWTQSPGAGLIMPSSVETSGSFAGNRPFADDRSIFFLFFLELEEVGLVIGLREFLGAIFAGDGDAEGELFAVDLVDSLGRLALGFFGAVFNDQVDGRERLGILVNFPLARVIHASDAGLDLFAVEGPGRVDAFTRRRPGSLKRLQELGLRRLVALSTREAKRSPKQGRQRKNSQRRRGGVHRRPNFHKRHDDSSQIDDVARFAQDMPVREVSKVR